MVKTYFFLKYNLIRILIYLFVLPKKAYGVEVGTWKGLNAKQLYYIARPKKLLLVDPYDAGLLDGVYCKPVSQETLNGYYEKVWRWTFNRNRVYLIRNSSKYISTAYSGGALDWAYIDGNHFTLNEDLEMWYPLIKRGGIIMGDDYNNKGYWKVKQDVNKFCEEKGLELHHLHFQWWFKKV